MTSPNKGANEPMKRALENEMAMRGRRTRKANREEKKARGIKQMCLGPGDPGVGVGGRRKYLKQLKITLWR